jgi:hypothetical protein
MLQPQAGEDIYRSLGRGGDPASSVKAELVNFNVRNAIV